MNKGGEFMAFINTLHRVIRKSNKDILNFYISNNNLFLKEFNAKKGCNTSIKLIENIEDYLININIDSNDKVYGIATPENGDVLYLYTDNENIIREKKLFSYDSEKYSLIYPYIKKSESTLHIIYLFQSIYNESIYSLFSHYFDGENWHENNIDFVSAHPFVTPFAVTFMSNNPTVFYFKDDEIFACSFKGNEKAWTSPTQITNTHNKKIYFSVLQDDKNLIHITWSEFINEHLVVRYTNGAFNNKGFHSLKITNISEPSNCSYPTVAKIKDILWNMWVQFDRLYSCYSIDNGITWSKPSIDSKSYEEDFIRYKFLTNHASDLSHFKVDNIFGIFNPRISFIGFDRSIES